MVVRIDDGNNWLVDFLLDQFQNRLPHSDATTRVKGYETSFAFNKGVVAQTVAGDGPDSFANLDDLSATKRPLRKELPVGRIYFSSVFRLDYLMIKSSAIKGLRVLSERCCTGPKCNC